MLHKVLDFLSSTKLALVLLVLISGACIAGVTVVPRHLSREIVFSSLWFNVLLLLLIVNIIFCITRRTRFLSLLQLGNTIFHLGLVLLFVGVVYDRLFFFEGAIRLTEGETLTCADPASWDGINTGRFFSKQKLNGLGELYFHKVHIDYEEDGKKRGAANEIALGEDVKAGRNRIIYVTQPFKYKEFEFYRNERDGYSPLFVLRDRQERVLGGSFAPLQSILQNDGTYIYRSGSSARLDSFDFPQYQNIPPVLKLQTAYHPDKKEKRIGEVSFRVRRIDPNGQESAEELFNGKAGFRERIKVGEYILSMDEVRYWTSMIVIYSPGLPMIYTSFWIILSGLILNLFLKVRKESLR